MKPKGWTLTCLPTDGPQKFDKTMSQQNLWVAQSAATHVGVLPLT
jgi:hypothetical protein